MNKRPASSTDGAIAVIFAAAFVIALGLWLGFSKVLWFVGSTVAVLFVIGLLAHFLTDKK